MKFLNFFKPISEYQLPQRPMQKRIKLPKEKNGSTENTVVGGVEYLKTETVEQGAKTVDWSALSVKNGMSVSGDLDRFDCAALDARFGLDETGFPKWNRQKAQIIKYEYAAGKSAQKIEKEHRGKPGGKVQSGFSARTVASYIAAFNEAKRMRESPDLFS